MDAIKKFLYAGFGGVLTYYLVSFVCTTLITGTGTVDTFVQTIVPLAIGFGVVLLIIVAAFKNEG